jgi:hypothetical protein
MPCVAKRHTPMVSSVRRKLLVMGSVAPEVRY